MNPIATRLSALLFLLFATASQAAVYTVTTAVDSGPGSLRQAILDANGNPGRDRIEFAIGSGPVTICPASNLPAITESVFVSGFSQPGWTDVPIVTIGGDCGATDNGLIIATGTNNVTIQGFILNHFPGNGIQADGGSGHMILGTWTGVTPDGLSGAANGANGIAFSGVTNSRIGGTSAVNRVIASGNVLNGISFSNGSNGNDVWNTFLGLDVNGTAAIGNGKDGFSGYDSANNTLGGHAPAYRVITSGNVNYGFTFAGPGSSGNRFIGSYACTDITGTVAIPNGRTGGLIYNAPSNDVGGTTAGERSVISGCGRRALTVDGSDNIASPPDYAGQGYAHDNRVLNVYFGLAADGVTCLPNQLGGMNVYNAQDTAVGLADGSVTAVISCNIGYGVLFLGTEGETNDNEKPDGNTIQNAVIGLSADLTTAKGNTSHGVFARHSYNTEIGDTLGNVIRFNGGCGLQSDGDGYLSNINSPLNTITDNTVCDVRYLP